MTDSVGSANENSSALFQWFYSFRDFIKLQSDSLTPTQGVELYDLYKQQFRMTKSRENLTNNLDWCAAGKDYYSPLGFKEQINLLKMDYQTRVTTFMNQLSNGEYNDLSLSLAVTDLAAVSFEPMDFPLDRIVGTIRTGSSCAGSALPVVDNCCVILKHLSAYIRLSELSNAVNEVVSGVRSISVMPSGLTDEYLGNMLPSLTTDVSEMGDELKNEVSALLARCYTRYHDEMRVMEVRNLLSLQTAWIEFESPAACEAAMGELSRLTIRSIALPRPQVVNESALKRSRVRVIPEYTDEQQIQADLESALSLLKVLHDIIADETVPNTILTSIPGLSAINALDLCIVYLAKVWYFDFYSGRFNWNNRAMYEVSGLFVGRIPSHLISKQLDYTKLPTHITNICKTDFKSMMLDFDESHPLIGPAWEEVCSSQTLEEDVDRFKCLACSKKFKGSEFVSKHLKNKHSSLYSDIEQKVKMNLSARLFELDVLAPIVFPIVVSDYSSRTRRNNGSMPKEAAITSGPQRRPRNQSTRSHPLYKRDWDAPRNRLEEKSRDGNFRTMMRYDDL